MANSILSPSHSSQLMTDSSATPPAKRFAASNSLSVEIAPVSRSSSAVSDENCPPLTGSKPAEIYTTEHFRSYDLAQRLYSGIRNGRLSADLHFDNSNRRLRVYRLVFDLLYHREIIEELLIESGFYSRNFHLKEQETLVLLMAYDYQDAKFSIKLPRNGGHGGEIELESVSAVMLTVAKTLCKHRVKLNAALARMRVESNAQTTSHLLPEVAFLKYRNTLTQPFYARINTRKVENIKENIISSLHEAGLTACSTEDELKEGGGKFCHPDEDLLAFSYMSRETVLHHPLLSEGYLVPQDSGSYYLVSELKEALSQISGDVIVTHCNAGLEVAHIASLMTGDNRVIVYGALPVQMQSLDNTLHQQHINNVEFIQAPFTSADSESSDLANVSLIVCLPPSSLSTVKQPINFILQEGDQFAPLLLSKKTSLNNTLAREQSSTLSHALTFAQCQSVVYAVRSHDDHETTTMVTGCLDQQETSGRETREYISDSRQPLTREGGYYISCLERRPESPKPTASEVIAKAVTSGVLSGEGLNLTPKSASNSPSSSKKKRKKPARIFSSHSGIPMTISARNKVTPKKTTSHDVNNRRPFR